MIIEPVAFFHSPLTSKFGIPRQSGLAPELRGTIVLTPEFRQVEAVRGLEGFDYLWLIWEFSANGDRQKLTARPPRLGGNERMGVFATRSPFRPNRMGLSCVRLDRIDYEDKHAPVLHVMGADLMDGTPIYDIKPYVAYADAHPEARCGFVDSNEWQPLEVIIPDSLCSRFSGEELSALRDVLAQDPRPPFHHDPSRVYGMPFGGADVRFVVNGGVLHVTDITE